MDRVIASWRARAYMICVAVLVIGAFINVALESRLNPAFTTAEMFPCVLPVMLVFVEFFVFLVVRLETWYKERNTRCQQVIVLSNEGVSYTLFDGHGTTAWDARAHYKETRWSFMIWWRGTPAWLHLPKRTFVDGDIDRCREILSEHAVRSTWFFG